MATLFSASLISFRIPTFIFPNLLVREQFFPENIRALKKNPDSIDILANLILANFLAAASESIAIFLPLLEIVVVLLVFLRQIYFFNPVISIYKNRIYQHRKIRQNKSTEIQRAKEKNEMVLFITTLKLK
jgi:hypothetical protein